MPEDKKPKNKPSRRARMIALCAGLLLGVSCYWVPPEYQDVCNTVAKVVGTTCGG